MKNQAEIRLEIHLQMETSHAFEFSWLFDLAADQKGVDQQRHPQSSGLVQL